MSWIFDQMLFSIDLIVRRLFFERKDIKYLDDGDKFSLSGTDTKLVFGESTTTIS